MAETGKEQSGSTWPLVKFKFLVKIGDNAAFFEEVTGLSAEIQQIEYRAGNNPDFSTVKMPGIKKFGNVTLKKGIFKDDKGFWELYKEVTMNRFERKKVTISLLDEKESVAMSWTLANAFPSRITVTDMNANGNEVVVESMELAHEGLALAK
ncbi:MAG TPA: phage tail protein [Ferruginibacter sp.]|mgnify:CR=1 FL=1|nr:phage tail protein [Ferruginibacter sp.]